MATITEVLPAALGFDGSALLGIGIGFKHIRMVEHVHARYERKAETAVFGPMGMLALSTCSDPCGSNDGARTDAGNCPEPSHPCLRCMGCTTLRCESLGSRFEVGKVSTAEIRLLAYTHEGADRFESLRSAPTRMHKLRYGSRSERLGRRIASTRTGRTGPSDRRLIGSCRIAGSGRTRYGESSAGTSCWPGCQLDKWTTTAFARKDCLELHV